MNLLHRRPRANRPSATDSVKFLTKVASAVASLMLIMSVATGPAHTYPTSSFISSEFRSALVQTVSSQRWFQGGTLHRSTLRQWLRASRRNQTATAADLTIHFLGEVTVIQLGMDAWRVYASSLVTCVNTAAAPPMMDRPVIEIAAACSVLLEQ